jgi:hypothetical protein
MLNYGVAVAILFLVPLTVRIVKEKNFSRIFNNKSAVGFELEPAQTLVF